MGDGGEDDDDPSYDEGDHMREHLNRSALSDSAQKGDLDDEEEDSEHDDYRYYWSHRAGLAV